MKSLVLRAALAVCAIGAAASAMAGPPVLQTGTYRLHNHRAGGQAPPAYGLRLDGLDGTRNPANIYSFDFDNAQSDMRMTLDLTAKTVRIFGTVYGGRDVGTTYENPSMGRVGLWQVDFLYDTNVMVQTSGRIVVSRFSNLNTGYIRPLFTSNVNAFRGNPQIALVDYNSVATAPSFLLGLNHRGNPGASGWGWLNHSGQSHVAASDWLFEVDPNPIPIPAPGAASLAMLGLSLAGALRRRLS